MVVTARTEDEYFQFVNSDEWLNIPYPGFNI